MKPKVLRFFTRELWLLLSFLAACASPANPRRVAPTGELVRFAPPFQSVFRPDPQAPYHLQNQEGEHLFILAKTAWHYFNAKDPQQVLARARAIGANVIRVALEGNLYFKDVGLDAWPWSGTRAQPNFTALNDRYWQRVEERIDLAGRAGIGVDLVLYASLHLNEADVPHQRLYWQHVLERLGRYSNIVTWEIQNEYVANERFQDEVAAFFQKHDKHRRPIITSNGTRDVPTWPHKPWMGMAITHTCTGSTERHPLGAWYLAVARNARSFGKPSFNNETGRENRHGNDDGVHRRKQAWLWSTAGGFWTWHSWDGCEGIDDPTYKPPGEEFMLPMATFFRSRPFWQLHPEHVAVQVSDGRLVQAALANVERSYVMAYVATEETHAQIKEAALRYRLRDGRYHVTFRAPASGRVVGETDIDVMGIGSVGTLPLPGFSDDLVIEFHQTKAAEATQMPRTQ